MCTRPLPISTIAAIAAGADGGRGPTVVVENVTTDTTLKFHDGRAISAHISSGLYVVLSDGSAAFELGKPAPVASGRRRCRIRQALTPRHLALAAR